MYPYFSTLHIYFSLVHLTYHFQIHTRLEDLGNFRVCKAVNLILFFEWNGNDSPLFYFILCIQQQAKRGCCHRKFLGAKRFLALRSALALVIYFSGYCICCPSCIALLLNDRNVLHTGCYSATTTKTFGLETEKFMTSTFPLGFM